jgi:hypothetical protein
MGTNVIPIPENSKENYIDGWLVPTGALVSGWNDEH